MTAFYKYQAAGNDFIILDSTDAYRRGEGEACIAYWQKRAKALCDRHFGIGADGILLVSNVPTAQADARMDIINADGSLAGMCGNGIRCAARYLADRGNPMDAVSRIDTLGGLQRVRLINGVKDYPIEVAMAKVLLGARDAYTTKDGTVFCGRHVDVGNPHFVIVNDAWQREDAQKTIVQLHAVAEQYGDELSHAPLFEDGANIEFACLLPNKTAAMAVYERGCGITLACGTGSTATGAVMMQDFGLEGDCTLHAEGGILRIKAPKKDEPHYRLCGDAVCVFEGWFGDEKRLE